MDDIHECSACGSTSRPPHIPDLTGLSAATARGLRAILANARVHNPEPPPSAVRIADRWLARLHAFVEHQPDQTRPADDGRATPPSGPGA